MVSFMTAFYFTKNEKASTEITQTESNETVKGTKEKAKDKENKEEVGRMKSEEGDPSADAQTWTEDKRMSEERRATH